MKRKMKVKVSELGKVYLLEEYGRISYVDKVINLVFITISDENIEKVKQLPFVTKVSESRKGNLLAV